MLPLLLQIIDSLTADFTLAQALNDRHTGYNRILLMHADTKFSSTIVSGTIYGNRFDASDSVRLSIGTHQMLAFS